MKNKIENLSLGEVPPSPPNLYLVEGGGKFGSNVGVQSNEISELVGSPLTPQACKAGSNMQKNKKKVAGTVDLKILDSACNPNPLAQPPRIYLADFAIGSPEFGLLSNRFMHPRAAVVLQHLEFLNRKFDLPPEGVYRNIYPCERTPDNKTISEHMGIKSRRLVFSILREIRVDYDFKKGVQLKPNEIDFQGKLYASYYLRSRRTVYWFRNASLINQLCAEIKNELLDQKRAKNLTHVVPRELLSELSGGVGGEPSSEPSSEPSYIEEVELKKLETEKYKAKNSLNLVPPLTGKNKTKPTGEICSYTEGKKVNKSSPIKKDKAPAAKLGAYVYPAYKDYCKTREKGFLMPDTPSGADVMGLAKFVHAFCALGFEQHEMPPFFALLGSKHDDATLYLQDHGVWEVKNHKIFFGIAILVTKASQFASWYKKKLNEISAEAEYKNSIAAKHNNVSTTPAPTKPFALNSAGYTYEARMANKSDTERESLEYQFVFFKRLMPESDSVAHFAQRDR